MHPAQVRDSRRRAIAASPSARPGSASAHPRRRGRGRRSSGPSAATWVSVWRSSRASSAPGAKVDSGTVSAPMRAAASQAMSHWAQLGNRMPTRVPLPTPEANSASASVLDCASASAKLSRSSSVTRNSPSGCARRSASSSGTLPGRRVGCRIVRRGAAPRPSADVHRDVRIAGHIGHRHPSQAVGVDRRTAASARVSACNATRVSSRASQEPRQLCAPYPKASVVAPPRLMSNTSGRS